MVEKIRYKIDKHPVTIIFIWKCLFLVVRYKKKNVFECRNRFKNLRFNMTIIFKNMLK